MLTELLNAASDKCTFNNLFLFIDPLRVRVGASYSIIMILHYAVYIHKMNINLCVLLSEVLMAKIENSGES